MLKLSEDQKVAVVLLAIGEELASELIKDLDPSLVKRALSEVSKIRKLESSVVDAVLDEFLQTLNEPSKLSGSMDFVGGVLKKAFGQDQSEGLYSEIDKGFRKIEVLGRFEPRHLFDVLKDQSPSIVATALAFCDAKQSSQVMKHFSQKDQVELLFRISKLESIDDETFSYLTEYLEESYNKRASLESLKVGGNEKVAQILQAMGKDHSDRLLEDISDKNKNTADKLESLMFRFDDLVQLDDKSMQAFVSKVDRKSLLLSCKKCSDVLFKKIVSSMSKNASEIFMDDFNSLPKTLLSDVEKAQNIVLSYAKDMIDKGDFVLVDPDEQYV